MIHELTIGYLNTDAIANRVAVVDQPLDEPTIARVLAEFPGLKIEQRDGYVIAPWHGKEDGDRGEAFAIRLQIETRCVVADRRNGRIVDLTRGAKTRVAG